MLKILMLLLTFTDFELSGQNIEPEAKRFCKFKQLNFMIHMGTIYYIWCMYIFICKRTRNQFNQKISTSGQIFFKVGLIWLVRGNSRSQERAGEGTPLHFFVRTTYNVRTHNYFFRPHLISSEQCFCVFKCIILCLLTLFLNLRNVTLFNTV